MSSHQPAVPAGTRQSHGLEQLFQHLSERPGAKILDLGEFTQANVIHLASGGHRLYFEDLLEAIDREFGPGDPTRGQSDNAKVRSFLAHSLQYQPASFEAVLVWDTLEHLTAPVVAEVVTKLHFLLKPGGLLLACFHSEARDDLVQTFSFRIAGPASALLVPKGQRKPAQAYNNRGIERLFEKFSAVKFFLTRDYIREVTVRK